MKIRVLSLVVSFSFVLLNAQVTSPIQEAWEETDRSVYFSVQDTGYSTPIIWGLDLAWLSESNLRRGIAFMGHENVALVRSSFTPTAPLENGLLPTDEQHKLDARLDLLTLLGRPMDVVLNCDHPSVDDWYKGNPANWAKLIELTARLHEGAGHDVIAVSPFNEPDYTATGQGTVGDFYAIAGELRNNEYFDDIRISGGNTLNTDEALTWYNALKGRLDEGNTHQLAGSFDHYAAFYETVRANSDHATNDELHNVMEAMVGVEYGLQTGIWWGTAEYTRGEFVRASQGRRLAYSEHRPNWTAASVYRHIDGRVQAFVGSSERQAVTTTYRLLSKDRDVYYDGHGPQREYIIEVPGGTAYQEGQSNAEGLVNISWGEDIQPIVDGQYKIVNKHSAKVMEPSGGSINGGVSIVQGTSKVASYQYWNVVPVEKRIGGDFSYFSIINAKSGKSLDVLNWSLDDGGRIIQWDDAKGANQQWYLQYAKDGWFYIRSRHSAKCLEVQNGSVVNGMKIEQADLDGADHQLWRFVPTDASVELEPPLAPENLRASTSQSSIRLDWNANTEQDLKAYTILRSQKADSAFDVIARGVTTTAFVDYKVEADRAYYYKIKALDEALNSSAYSTIVSARGPSNRAFVAHYTFEDNTSDSSMNLAHAKAYGACTYVGSRDASQAIQLNGDDAFVQLPSDLIKRNALSVSTWVKWTSGASWSRIFDFGNDQNQYVCLTPRLRFTIKDGGAEQRLEAPSLPKGAWAHVVLTMDTATVKIYVDGALVAESHAITLHPFDFKPGINYIGRSQLSSSLFEGCIDDFTMYNFALTPEEVGDVFRQGAISQNITLPELQDIKVWPVPSHDKVFVSCPNTVSSLKIILYDLSGKELLQETAYPDVSNSIDLSHLSKGIYPMILSSGEERIVKKLIKQ